MQQVMNILSQDSMKFICLKKLDLILVNRNSFSMSDMLDVVADLRDEIERFC